MNKNVLNFAGCLALSLAAGSVSAANWFVSADGTWAMTNAAGQAMTGTKTTSLNTAVSAIHTAADIVWVQDGFVCSMKEDAGNISGTTSGKARIKLHNSAFTLRSESGYVDEAAGKGAYIRGFKAVVDGYDKNNVRPIWSQNAGSVIQGFVLEDGATGSSAISGLGGAVYGAAIISNCVVRNCTAYAGGAFGSLASKAQYVTAYNTVISNCNTLATKYGGGAVYGVGTFFDCKLEGNRSACHGGAISDEDTKNVPIYVNCVFSDNKASEGGGIYFATNAVRATITNCQFINNEATESGAGGVCGKATLAGCVLSGNKSANGAAAFSTVSEESCYSCLFSGNTTTNGTIVAGAIAAPLKLFNCTFADNVSSASCVSGATIENGIIWGNTYGDSELTDCTVTYSCVKGVSGVGNIDLNPKLTEDYRLTKTSPCVGTAKQEDWMTSGDARSFDAAGYPRIRRPLPDMGAYAMENPGSMVIGR